MVKRRGAKKKAILNQTKTSQNQKIVVILVSPQLGENIGAVARVMRNFGFYDLRIVSPRDGWPNQKAADMAVTAVDIINNAKIFESVKDAVADIQYLFATTARRREMVKPAYTSREIGKILFEKIIANIKCGIMFGAERTGLTNEDVTIADAIVTIPVSPDFTSLNLAQAAGIIMYEIFSVVAEECPTGSWNIRPYKGKGDEKPASRKEVILMFEHLEKELELAGHFKAPGMKEVMIENIRNLFMRAELTDQEVRTLRGIIASLTQID